MKAMAIRRYGGPEVLEPMDLPMPQPADGEVRVKIHAAGVNPVDYQRRRNGPYADFPVVLGWDLSGVVDALGAGVTDPRVGDEVYGMIRFPKQGRAYAEYATAPVTEIAPKPKRLDHVQAAATPLASLTALLAIETMDLQAGETVLVHAGAGGVGHFAVQLAKARGARVIATASAQNRDLVLGLGADEVIDYRARPFEEQVPGVDAVFDTVGGDTFTRSFRVAKPGGRVVGTVTPMTDELDEQARQAGVDAAWIAVAPSRPKLEALSALVEAGRLTPHVGQTFPLERVVDAHRAQESGRTVGKIVLTVA